MWLAWLELIGGLAVLIFAGDYLVKSAVSIAKAMQVSAMVIGLTVVSFGTSFPELVVSLNAALSGHPEISIGNVVGSNIANIALVLGLSAFLFPIAIGRRDLFIDWPVMLAATALLIGLTYDGMLERWEGALLLVGIVAYNVWILKSPGRKVELDEEGLDAPGMFKPILVLVLSLVALIGAAEVLVDGAVKIAGDLGVPKRVIAVSVIAFGTSVPELATSLIALKKQEVGISLGNLIGSNVFNILGILGVTATAVAIPVGEETIQIDYLWMAGIPLALFFGMWFGRKVNRLLGAALLLAYFTYIALQFSF